MAFIKGGIGGYQITGPDQVLATNTLDDVYCIYHRAGDWT
jgi:hypothetical protein